MEGALGDVNEDKTAIRAGVGQFGHRPAGTITGPVGACTQE